MSTQEQPDIRRLHEQLAQKKRGLTIIAAISLGLLFFLLISLYLIYSWSGELDVNSLWPFILLFIVDLPLLYATFRSFVGVCKIKSQISSAGKSDTDAKNYTSKKVNFKQLRVCKLGNFVLPLLALIYGYQCLTSHMPSKYSYAYPALFLICFVVNLRKTKKLKQELEASDITAEEKAAFAAEEKRMNKIYLGIVGVILFIALIVSCSMDGGRNSHYDNSKLKEVFNKDPNTWTPEEHAFVNELFEHIGK